MDSNAIEDIMFTEVPRLTSTLRAFESENKNIFDLSSEYLSRKAFMEKYRALKNRANKNKNENENLSRLEKIKIALFQEPKTSSNPFPKEIYFQFLKCVEEMIGVEMPSTDLLQNANTIFDILCDLNVLNSNKAELVEKKQTISKLLGHFPTDTAIKLSLECIFKLKKFEKQKNIQNNPSESKILTQKNIFEEKNEFGFDLNFKTPSVNGFALPSVGATSSFASHVEELAVDTWQTTETALRAGESEKGFSEKISEKSFSEEKNSRDENVFSGGLKFFGDEKNDIRWFWRKLENFSSQFSQFSCSDLAMMIFKLLDSDQSGDEIAAELFDFIGDNGFEIIQEFLIHRKEIVDSIRKKINIIKNEKSENFQHSRLPRHGSQVTVQTETEKKLEKIQKKENKKMAKARIAGMIDAEEEFINGIGGFYALVEVEESQSQTLINSLMGSSSSVSIQSLPKGTKRVVRKGYEEVHVPPLNTAPLLPSERLVSISELDEFAKLAFEGYKTLNRIQSRIYEKAYFSNENILVCAPTGAGKTNIAMITILHEIKKHFSNGFLEKNNFKIVYIAPMKALAAEMTAAFGRRLNPLDFAVKELTGDMQLTKKQLDETQMIVTTPEKWDVITRKSSDVAFSTLVKLLIIDEVHLLNDERGPVIESIVARTLRQVESSQSMIRIVGLSATLPNYKEVAQFLRVNLDSGMFYFDGSFRPVPLSQQYIGISEQNFAFKNKLMHEICYNKMMEAVRRGQQAMVFVHSRKDTIKTARILLETAQRHGEVGQISAEDHPQFGFMKKELSKSRNRELKEIFESGFGIHHAGMLRSDRNLTEKLFNDGLIKVLVCTATLAWGVNLPAHMVIIKGTQLYDPKAGGFRELGMLDVMQIFGRAGRPQFDKSGEAIIITTHDKLAHYLRLMTHQLPIESQFISMLKDNLNAEIVLGTVTNVKEACAWLAYTYLYVRMKVNPLAYGITWEDLAMDPNLTNRLKALITQAARDLDGAKMTRFDERSGNLYVTELGRVASHFYIQYTSVETYNEMLKRHMSDSEVINMVAHSSEFKNIIVREEEFIEIQNLKNKFCPLEVRGNIDDKFAKINILIQVYLSRGFLDGFSLIADSSYISASLGRIMRALFEICLKRGWCSMSALFLEYCKAVEKRIWPHQHPLRQFEPVLSAEVLYKLEQRNADMDKLYDMDEKEISSLIRNPHGAKMIFQCLRHFPSIQISAKISPITRTVLKVVLDITPEFEWKEKFHGLTEKWWIWVEDSENEHIYHSELFTLSKKMMSENNHYLIFNIPIFEPLPAQYYVRAISDTWIASSAVHTISFKHLILPERHPPHTELLNLRPLPKEALGVQKFIDLYSFSHFNPIQTQAFHVLYHTDHNVLLGAPTGSGKTVSAELAMLRLFSVYPTMKVIYIAPLKALVRERMEDWKRGLVPKLNKKMVELTGDFTPDMNALTHSDIIISTPEKWDGISRNWKNRSYAQKVGLMIIDEIHLLGADRGPIIEVIVSRMRYISAQTDRPIRFVGLSTALANSRDLADWLGIKETGLFNFKPSVRPVPLDVHIQGYPGRFYCPRMNAMNKPTYASIMTHSPFKPVIIFVSSRRQTRLTALDLIQYAAADENPRQFLHAEEGEINMIMSQISSQELKHTLPFGIGIHHAGLSDKDRSMVEELFANRIIQVLVCTSTLAWGVNLPAHLVVVKGTEFYDAKTKRYVDFPITDILQMMGRAGRPQFDQEAKAVILVHEPKKSFYKKFLYEPFPVESSLPDQLHDHLNAEIASGTICSMQDACDYLTWTFFYRRLVMNPSYYGMEETSAQSLNLFLSELISDTLQSLQAGGCVDVHEDGIIEPLMLGHVASNYYLRYTTAALFSKSIRHDTSMQSLLHIIASASEFDELPVRHNEEKYNAELAKQVRWAVDARTYDDPHTKANLLFQVHFSRGELPVSDYLTDTKSAIDQSIRIIQSCVDVAANNGYLSTSMNCMRLMQMIIQGLWYDTDSSLNMLPHMTEEIENEFSKKNIKNIFQFIDCSVDRIRDLLKPLISHHDIENIISAHSKLPRVSIQWKLVESQKSKKVNENEKEVEKEKENENMFFFLEVNLVRKRLGRVNRNDAAHALALRFHKVKDEGWWLVIGDSSSDELLALKRVSFTDQLKTRLLLPFNLWSANNRDLKLFLVSDTYIGLDQTRSLNLKDCALFRNRNNNSLVNNNNGKNMPLDYLNAKKLNFSGQVSKEQRVPDDDNDPDDRFYDAHD